VEAIGHRQAKEQAVDMQRVQEQQQRVSPPAM